MKKMKATDILQIIAGTFILAVSIEYFVIPNNILSGGAAGIGVALEPLIHVSPTVFANILMVVLLVVGMIFLGKEFLARTILSTLLYPVFTTLLSLHPVTIEVGPAIAAIYAGLLGGAGIGMVIRTGASTGGMDIPPLILNKLCGVKVPLMVMIDDTITILLGIYSHGIAAALIGMLSVFASGFAMNRILEAGGVKAKSVQIISDHYEEIQERIQSELKKGVTLLEGKGGHTHEPRQVILSVVYDKQYNQLLSIIEEIDPEAFVITSDVTDMHGQGFTYTSPNI